MIDDFCTLVNALAVSLGLTAVENKFDRVEWDVDGMKLTIEYLPSKNMVWLHCPFGTVDDSLVVQALQRVFLAQYFLIKTYGNIITREDDGQFVLNYLYPVSRLDNAKIVELVEVFINLVELAKERLQHPLDPYTVAKESEQDDKPMDFLSMLNARV